MRKLLNALVVSLFILLPIASPAQASPNSIALSSGVILPNQGSEIFFTDLAENTVYQMTCNINSNDISNQTSDYIKVYSSDDHLRLYINGRAVNQPAQARISAKVTNQLVLTNVTRASDSVVITNLDNTDTLTVQYCHADVARGSAA